MKPIVRLVGGWIAARRNRKAAFEFELAVCAIFKNEGPYLEEWLTFHYGVGVQHFFLYNDASDDNWAEVLEPWIRRGLVTVTDWPTEAQVPAYNHCIRNNRDRARWIAFIDLDEFLYSPSGRDLPDVLRDYTDVAAIFVYWVLFGSSGHRTRPEGPVIEAYTRCLDLAGAIDDRFDHGKSQDRSDYVTGWSRDGKSIVNPRMVRRYNVHKPKFLWAGEVLDENRRPARQRDRGVTVSYAVLRINHYWAKSLDEMTEKVARGSICNRNRPKRNLQRWLERERMLNGSEDRTIQPLWDRIKSGRIATSPAEAE
ncbi:glycosyl transferase [Aquibium carbonis]|uniref:Glycosyl transferase n=1 Tax=Aquibium carbonis TaxID=2495581 RepID=A0A3R9YUM7_9HYPH|nr:glycosyltransferase family 92 protein [Aquibium carbonis]RST87534.1 glycosyl transferase [Aquibium carbonis]